MAVPEDRLQHLIANKNHEEAVESARLHGYDEGWALVDGALVVYDLNNPPAWFPKDRDEDGNTIPYEGHRVQIEFDDGVFAKLIHPESGCKPATQCSECGADFTVTDENDPEYQRCYDCKGINYDPDSCWLTDWFDAVMFSEIAKGTIECPIETSFDWDMLEVEVLQP